MQDATMNDIKTDTQNRLGDILLDLMLIAMYGDEHEADYEILGGHVAKEIWHYRKANGMFGQVLVNSSDPTIKTFGKYDIY